MAVARLDNDSSKAIDCHILEKYFAPQGREDDTTDGKDDDDEGAKHCRVWRPCLAYCLIRVWYLPFPADGALGRARCRSHPTFRAVETDENEATSCRPVTPSGDTFELRILGDLNIALHFQFTGETAHVLKRHVVCDLHVATNLPQLRKARDVCKSVILVELEASDFLDLSHAHQVLQGSIVAQLEITIDGFHLRQIKAGHVTVILHDEVSINEDNL
mmetsp:Transcript_49080/g.88217  ORF Transcript_49080/g.88217 Transcript_49080/m.88217 type:complete len:217 (+) Transcript_49080:168-818(+)